MVVNSPTKPTMTVSTIFMLDSINMIRSNKMTVEGVAQSTRSSLTADSHSRVGSKLSIQFRKKSTITDENSTPKVLKTVVTIGAPRNYLRRGLNLKQVRYQKYDFFVLKEERRW